MMLKARAIFGRNFALALACLSLALDIGTSAHAQSDSFYNGKTVRIIVGFTPGGFYDRWARLLSRYMPKYIPGSPDDVPASAARSTSNPTP